MPPQAVTAPPSADPQSRATGPSKCRKARAGPDRSVIVWGIELLSRLRVAECTVGGRRAEPAIRGRRPKRRHMRRHRVLMRFESACAVTVELFVWPDGPASCRDQKMGSATPHPAEPLSASSRPRTGRRRRAGRSSGRFGVGTLLNPRDGDRWGPSERRSCLSPRTLSAQALELR